MRGAGGIDAVTGWQHESFAEDMSYGEIDVMGNFKYFCLGVSVADGGIGQLL